MSGKEKYNIVIKRVILFMIIMFLAFTGKGHFLFSNQLLSPGIATENIIKPNEENEELRPVIYKNFKKYKNKSG